MAKKRNVFVCQQCGAQSPKWLGRCAECGEWNSLVEELAQADEGPARRSFDRHPPVAVTAIEADDEPRLCTGIDEFDRMLGGGIVPGSGVLIGGDPGIGKSTLVLQVCDAISRSRGQALYVTGEESLKQIRLRAERLGSLSDDLLVLAETNLDAITDHVQQLQPRVFAIDSIQMIYKPELGSAPGSVAQVRECAAELIYLAKRIAVPLFIVGHVTKEGTVAGPRTLEHIVDTVLYFEGDRFQAFRILRAVKNRFGATNEIGVFEMQAGGLQPVGNPSELFLSDREGIAFGSVVVPCMEGTRSLLVEAQALTARATFGTPERKVTGADRNRLAMLLAVLDKRAGLQIGVQDVFVNIVGGVRVEEPAADLGLALAIASSFRERPIPQDVVVTGEVGLGGEIRGVTQIDLRLKEAERLGFKRAVIPDDSIKAVSAERQIELLPAKSLTDVVEMLL